MKISSPDFENQYPDVVEHARMLITDEGLDFTTYAMHLAEVEDDLILACWKPTWLIEEIGRGNYKVPEYTWVSVELPNPYSEKDFDGGAPYRGSKTMSLTGISLVQDGGW